MRLLSLLSLITLSAGIDCKSKDAHLCDLVKEQVQKIFGDTMDGNFSLLVGNRNGRLLSAGHGMATDEEVVIASASKMINAAAILWAVDRVDGIKMSDPVHNFLPWWNMSWEFDPRNDVTLEHMLSQTDGFGQSPTFNFSEGAEAIYKKDYASLATPPKIFTIIPAENYTKQMTFGPVAPSPYTWGKTGLADLPRPGQVFYYEETHWRMGEAVVQQIANKSLEQVTTELTSQFGMKHSHLENIPSLGGPEWISTAEDLEIFLKHVVDRDFLKEETHAAYERSHTDNATWYGFRMRPDWGYAMGSWSHCPKGPCSQLSSIGLFGTFPFVDLKTGLYFALVRPAGVDPKRGVLMDRSVAFWEALQLPLQRAAADAALAI